MAVRLSQHLAPFVRSQSRTRGSACFHSGAVRSLTAVAGVPGIIEAAVRGSQPYAVWIEASGAELRGTCTCPHFIDRIDICKHIWAVVLAAESQGIPLLAPGTTAKEALLVPFAPEGGVERLDEVSPAAIAGTDDDANENEDEDDAGDDVHVRDTPAYGRRMVARRPPAARRRAAPRWRDILKHVTAPPAPTAAPPPPETSVSGQFLYVIDIPASTASQALVVELMTRDRKMNGDWGKPRTAHVNPAAALTHQDATERDVLTRLFGPRPHFAWGGYSPYAAGYGSSKVELRGVLISDLVPRMCATGRCVTRTIEAPPLDAPGTSRGRFGWRPPPTSAIVIGEPLVWDDGAPWAFTLRIRTDDGAYSIDGWLTRGDERIALVDAVLLLEGHPDGLVLHAGIAARLRVGAAAPWLALLRRGDTIAIPAEGRDALIDALLAAEPPVADVPLDLRIEVVQGACRPVLRFHPSTARRDLVRAELAFDYGGTIVAPGSPAGLVRAEGSARAVRRDTGAEQRAVATLTERGCRPEYDYETGQRALHLAAHAMPRVVQQCLGDGWHVEASGRACRTPGNVSVSVRSGIDWFELHGDVDYGGAHAPLPRLLAALDRGESFVTLDDGSMGLLPEEWLRQNAVVARMGAPAEDHVRFTRAQAGLLDALVSAQPQASWDDMFARTRDRLHAFEGVHPLDPPSTFTGTLRGYQRDGLGWLQFLQEFGFGGCLADDMGLGKTVMVLALLAMRRESAASGGTTPSLVVAPRSLMFNWQQEATRFTPHLRVLEYTGPGRAAMRQQFAEYDIVLTTYGTLRRDAATLTEASFDYVVLDEAQAIKNASSVAAKATRVLRAQHRLALSGTPIENHLGELWSLFEFLNPGLLSSGTSFARSASRQPDDHTIALLTKGLGPFILRRTKEQVATDLPAKTEQTLYCELERSQRALYDELRQHYRRTLLTGSDAAFGRSKMHVLEALLRLRQAACHPGLVDKRRHKDASAKLDVILPRLVEAQEEGHKTLVFSQFTSFLALLRTKLDAAGITYEYLDGRTRDRQSKVDRFQTDPQCRLFLISLKAGGLGLNLTAAEYVFLLDPWWNPAVEAQAIDRAHRIGQSRHVFAYRLIARDTVEERLVELQQSKRQLADAILAADNAVLRNLRREDLDILLS